MYFAVVCFAFQLILQYLAEAPRVLRTKYSAQFGTRIQCVLNLPEHRNNTNTYVHSHLHLQLLLLT